jgi:excisionase family DNA binding protein
MNRLLTISEAGKLIEGLTKYRIRQWCKEGKLPFILAGKKYLVQESGVHECLRNQLTAAGAGNGDCSKAR